MKEGIISRNNCPICTSESSRNVFNRSFNEKVIKDYIDVAYHGKADLEFLKDVLFEIVKCNKCGLFYQKYVFDDKHLKDLYNKWIDPSLAEEWNNKKNKEIINHHYSNILNSAVNLLKKEASDIQILDYGAGFGDFLMLANKLGFDSYAFEFSNERINVLQNNGINVINNESEILFDFIVINQVLEHLTNPSEVLREVSLKLKTNGFIYISVPNCNNFINNLKGTDKITDPYLLHNKLINSSIAPFQHINFFTNSSLKKLLKIAGLRPINPLKEIIFKTVTIKSILRPLYRYYFSTNFILTKI
jgi:SAM-dependent methyltransferase